MKEDFVYDNKTTLMLLVNRKIKHSFARTVKGYCNVQHGLIVPGAENSVLSKTNHETRNLGESILEENSQQARKLILLLY